MLDPLSEPGALSEAELDAIEARAAAALPGPWQGDPLTGTMVVDQRGREIVSCLAYPADALPTVEFIAQARTDVPRLVAEVRHLRELLQARADGRSTA
jgi:hypothetical protein